MTIRPVSALGYLLVVSALTASPQVAADQLTAADQSSSRLEDNAPPELVALAEEFREWMARRPEAVRDYSAWADERRRGLADFRRRLDVMESAARQWEVPVQVDYLVLKIEMNRLHFDLEVIREVSRNPNFYVNQAVNGVTRHIGGRYQTGPRAVTVPYDRTRAEAIIAALNRTPEIVEQAPQLLTEAVPEMADMTIKRLENVRENYAELARVVAQHVPDRHRRELTQAASRAGEALERYRQWLVANRQNMTAPVAIGRPAFDWYVQHVYAMPYNGEQLLVQAEMERLRNWTYLQLERQKNRHLPRPGSITDVPARAATSNEEFADWKDATDLLTRLWIEEHDLLTVPDYVGPIRQERTSAQAAYIEPFEFLAFPREQLPDGEKRKFVLDPQHYFESNYWNTGHRIDPGVNHPHSDIPGHTFEGMVSQRTTRPLRRGHNTRGDAFPFYWEHLQLQLDYPFVRGPTIREWMWGLNIMRAERVFAAVKMADGSLTPQEVGEHMMENVPWMEPFVAFEHEVWRKFTQPAGTLTYQVATFQLMKLLRERMMKMGDAFDLREFHDELLATGQIPISLARWEMTGLDDDMRHLWSTPAVPTVALDR